VEGVALVERPQARIGRGAGGGEDPPLAHQHLAVGVEDGRLDGDTVVEKAVRLLLEADAEHHGAGAAHAGGDRGAALAGDDVAGQLFEAMEGLGGILGGEAVEGAQGAAQVDAADTQQGLEGEDVRRVGAVRGRRHLALDLLEVAALLAPDPPDAAQRQRLAAALGGVQQVHRLDLRRGIRHLGDGGQADLRCAAGGAQAAAIRRPAGLRLRPVDGEGGVQGDAIFVFLDEGVLQGDLDVGAGRRRQEEGSEQEDGRRAAAAARVRAGSMSRHGGGPGAHLGHRL
jgi:hypothetical protein